MKPERGVNAITHEDNRGNRVASTEITTEQGRRFSVITQGIPGIRDDGKIDYITSFHRTSPRSRRRPQLAFLNETEVTNKKTARTMHKKAVGEVILFLEQSNARQVTSMIGRLDLFNYMKPIIPR